MALMILELLALGISMSDLPLSPQKLVLYSWPKWFGVTAFLLVWLRLAWRVTHRPPALPEALLPPMRFAANAGHAGLYLMMMTIPFTGWLMSSAKDFQTVWFGLTPIVDLVGRDKALGDLLQQTPKVLNFLLMATLADHLLAAQWNHFVLRDNNLLRIR